MMRSKSRAAVVLAFFIGAGGAHAQGSTDKEHADLAKALAGVKVSLERGLAASASNGKPISAKFEVEDGKLQLSVYTMKGDKFTEVVVNDATGKVAEATPITEGDDLTAAKAQSDAMAQAKLSLRAAVRKAVGANKGFRAASVVPEL